MGEYNSERDKFWAIFQNLSPSEQLEYLWESFGDSLMDQVKNWDDEVLENAIQELKDKVE